MSAGKKSLIKWVIITLILSGFISFATSFEYSQLQWEKGISGKLQRGEQISYKGYSVKAMAFPAPVESDKYQAIPAEPVEPSVVLNISKNGGLIETAILGPGDSYIAPDGELQVTAKQFPSRNATDWLFESYNPWVIVELNPRGKPHLEVSIDTDKNEYILASAAEIVATLTLKNTGSADALNVDMPIDTELQIKRGNSKYHYERVKKGESIKNIIAFSLPTVAEKRSYRILANVSGYDVKDVPNSAEFVKTITISPETARIPSMKKIVNSKVYLKDYAMVSLSLKNNGNYDLKNVSITDSIPDSFKLIGNSSLHWVIDIPANGYWDARYLIKPMEPNKNGIVLPAATAKFQLKKEYYFVQSNQPEIVVYGAKVVLNKQTDVSEINTGGTVTVTVVAKNIGNTPAKVSVRDELPVTASIVSGITMREEYLEANKEIRFSYVLEVHSKQTIKLPPATAEYYELGMKGAKISTASKQLEIKIRSPGISVEIPVIESTDTGTLDRSNQHAPGEPETNESRSGNRSSNETRIDLPESINTQVDINAFLKLLLGCDKDNDNKSRFYAEACSFFSKSNASSK